MTVILHNSKLLESSALTKKEETKYNIFKMLLPSAKKFNRSIGYYKAQKNAKAIPKTQFMVG